MGPSQKRHPLYKIRRKLHSIDGPWITFEGGGKLTYRRRKTKAERKWDKAQHKLSDWGKDITREAIREAFFNVKGKDLRKARETAKKLGLYEKQIESKTWIDWARKQIDLDQNA